MRSPQSAILYPLVLSALILAAQIAKGQQLTSGGASAAADSAKVLADIVAHMEQAQLDNRAKYRPYTLTREYRFYGGSERKPNAEILANVSFVPPDKKTFKIEHAQGSERDRGIVHKLLERESEAAAGHKAPGAITDDNYRFMLIGDDNIDGHSCWLLELKPKRDEKDLVRGRACVDKDSYLIHWIQGEMAKTPSWWLKKVSVTLQFGNAGGMWLQTGTQAVADVRVFGRHTLTEQAVKIQMDDQLADIVPGSPQFAAAPARAASRAQTKAEPISAASDQGFVAARGVMKRRPAAPVPAMLGAGVLAQE